jgi:hypothetical protein
MTLGFLVVGFYFMGKIAERRDTELSRLCHPIFFTLALSRPLEAQ